jgi:hypothetical protein
MDPSTQRQEHITHAIIGLGIMALVTSIFHIYTTSHFWRSAKPPPPGASPQTVDQYNAFIFVTVFLWIALVGAWAIGLSFWITHFGFISIVHLLVGLWRRMPGWFGRGLEKRLALGYRIMSRVLCGRRTRG